MDAPESHENVPSRSVWSKVKAALPEGKALPEEAWEARHRFVLWFIWIHAVGLAVLGLLRNWSPAFALGEGALIAGVGFLAAWPRLGRTFRSAAAAFAAATSSAVLTQFMGGYIEGHFHYFVVVALIALYQDWVAFSLAVGFVALDHGAIGTLYPQWVYNHPAAIANPWLWAGIHAGLVLMECVVLIMLWKANERSRARTDLVLRSASEGIVGLDLQGRVTFVNPAAAEMLSAPENAILGQPLDFLLPSSSNGGHSLSAAGRPTDSGATAAPHSGSLVLGRDAGGLPVDWTANAAREHGVKVGTVVTLVDATPRQRAEQERAKRLQQVTEMERLQEMDRFKTLFINTAAHELHTPLTPLRLAVFSLAEGHKGQLNPGQQATVDVLDRNVRRLGSLVEDVLNAARLQANRMTLQKSTTDLSTLVHEAVDAYEEAARAAGISMNATIPPALPVAADGRRLAQVLDNLLDNAVKFTPKGGRVAVEVGREDGGAFVRVSDTGVGIPKGELARLFQPFSQAHNPMQQTKVGSGLGLYISRGIVELHGGRIEGRSDGAGKGATFSFVIPLE